MQTNKKRQPGYQLEDNKPGNTHLSNEMLQNNNSLRSGEKEDDEHCDNTEDDPDEPSRIGIEDIGTSLPGKDPEDNYFKEGDDIHWGVLDTEEDE